MRLKKENSTVDLFVDLFIRQSTETKLKLATRLCDRKRHDEGSMKLDLSTLHDSAPVSEQTPSQSFQRNSNEEYYGVEQAMYESTTNRCVSQQSDGFRFAEVKPEDLITPRTPTPTHRSPAPSKAMNEKLHCAAADDGTVTECTDETDKIEDGIIEFEESLTTPCYNVDKFLQLASESDDALNVIAELERRVDEHESIAERESVEVVLLALSQEMAMEIVDSEIVLIARGITFSRDKITALVRDSLLEGCLDSIDNSSHAFVKSEILRES